MWTPIHVLPQSAELRVRDVPMGSAISPPHRGGVVRTLFDCATAVTITPARPPTRPSMGAQPGAAEPAADPTAILRCGVSLCGRPHRPASHIHPQRHSAPLVADSATPRPTRSTPRGGFPSPAPAAFAAMTRLRASSGRTTRRRYAPRASAVPAFRVRDFSQAWMGHPDKFRCDERGDSRTYAAPGFHFAPRPVQFESRASAASSGKSTA
ncbi:hypothetical protein B0H14DRAFT_3517299 [Mycena olivaceomarginata]|nr:hypothetical protein B0H14DRAFT_3517299 [Mycena olivaceomarginata]